MKEVFSEPIINHAWFDEGLAMAFLRLGGAIHYDNFRIVQWACANSLQLMHMLLSEPFRELFDVNMDDGLLLKLACQSDQPEIVELLIKAGADLARFGNEFFLEASAGNKLEVVKLLLDFGVDVHFNRDYALREASRLGNVKMVNALLLYGADVHAFNESALLTACHKGHVEVVKVLVEHGADLNFNRGSALRFSASQGHRDVVSLLLQKGIDALAHECGALALRDGARRGHLNVVKELILYGIPCSSLNSSALLCAILNDNMKVARFLLEHGANPDLESLEFKRHRSSLSQRGVDLLLKEFNIQM
ncbi:hypothetical protein L0F63_007208 [Massospora cicadina]|nr:hypothetical protein L0F63_007208 [Massospora cicadina]